jgi:2-iminobutanoate/2-iminopropanoate deaminase
MGIERIFPPNAPTPRGPYSPAVRAGDFIYISAQGPVDPVTDRHAVGDIKQETHRVLSNLKAILADCGATTADVVQCSVFLKDAGDFAGMNEVYGEFFAVHRPARTTVEAKLVNSEVRVMIDCVVYKPK